MASHERRLLFVSHTFPPKGSSMPNVGGMQRVSTELHDALGQHPDIELFEELLSSSRAWTEVRTAPFLVKLLMRIPRLVETHAIDSVLFSSMVTAAVAPVLRRLLPPGDVQLAAISHGRDVTLPNSLYQRFIPSVFNALDLVLPVSSATAEACRERGLPTSNCRVVPNGVNPSRFERSRSTNNRPRPAADGLSLCSVGRQVERKGFSWFVREVIPLLPATVGYHLAGDGPEHDEIAAAAREEGVADRVHLLGKIPEAELVDLYHRSDLFIMPNIPVAGDMEGFGIVMLEAGVCGVPTIAANLEGIRDVISEGKNGHLLRPMDPRAFADQINYYADRPDALAGTSRSTKQFTRETFAWSSIVDRYVDALTGAHSMHEEAAA